MTREVNKEAENLGISVARVGPFWVAIWDKTIIAKESSEKLCLECAIARRKAGVFR